jgi:hypothetical protein
VRDLSVSAGWFGARPSMAFSEAGIERYGPRVPQRSAALDRGSPQRCRSAMASNYQSDGLAGGTSSKNAVIIGSRTCTTPEIEM